MENPQIGPRKKGRVIYAGQATLELSLAVVGVFILFLGMLNLFVWLNKRLVTRQQAYEESRIRTASECAYVDHVTFAGSYLRDITDWEVDEKSGFFPQPPLRILGEPESKK